MSVLETVIFLMSVLEERCTIGAYLFYCLFITLLTQKLGATAREGFHILILQPKIHVLKKTPFWGRLFGDVLPF